MARVFLVRHGTHALVGKVLAGRMPGVSLSEDGHRQAARVAAHFAGQTIGAVLSSPMERCRETAAPIAARLGLQVHIQEALNELDCGAWTGEPFDALHHDPRWTAWNNERASAVIPDGETIAAVARRAMALLDPLVAADGEPTILVTHSDIIKTIVLTLLGGPLEHHDRLDIDPASITTLDLWPGGGKVVRSNEQAA